jgi:hypothetical protein
MSNEDIPMAILSDAILEVPRGRVLMYYRVPGRFPRSQP